MPRFVRALTETPRLLKLGPRLEMLNAKLISLRAAFESRT